MFYRCKHFLFIIAFSLCLFTSSAASAAVNINKVDFSLNDKYAKLVINISKSTKFKAFSLATPDRLVVDITGAKLPNKKPEIDDGILVNKIRYGTPNSKTVRIVLDMQEPVKIIDSAIKKGTKNFPQNQIIISYTSLSGKMPYLNRDKSGKELDVPASMRYSYKGKNPFNTPTFKPFSIKNYDSKKSNISISKPKIIKKPLIVIDAGHGGIDPGAIGKKGTKEKNITIAFTKELRKILLATGKYKVALTRTSDKYLKLNKRVKLAQKAQGDIFISIHADSHRSSKTRGLSVYTISENRSKREANKLYRKSNKHHVLNGVNLKNQTSDVRGVLIDLARRDTKNTSIRFAETLVKELGDDAKLLKNTHRDASLAVLTGMDIPSALIELGYLSNRYEENQLRTKKYRSKLANGIKDALNKYFVNIKK